MPESTMSIAQNLQHACVQKRIAPIADSLDLTSPISAFFSLCLTSGLVLPSSSSKFPSMWAGSALYPQEMIRLFLTMTLPTCNLSPTEHFANASAHSMYANLCLSFFLVQPFQQLCKQDIRPH